MAKPESLPAPGTPQALPGGGGQGASMSAARAAEFVAASSDPGGDAEDPFFETEEQARERLDRKWDEVFAEAGVADPAPAPPQTAGERGVSSTPEAAGSSGDPPNPSQETAPPWAQMQQQNQQFMLHLQEQNQKFMAGIMEAMQGAQASPQKEGGGPADWSPTAQLREYARSVAGKGASDRTVDQLASDFKRAIWAEEMGQREEWKDNPQAQEYIAGARQSWERAAAERSESASLRQELSELKEQIADLREAPVRARTRDIVIDRWGEAFRQPQPDGLGVTPEDHVGLRFPRFAEVARKHNLRKELAQYAIERHEAITGKPFDGSDNEHIDAVWAQVNDLNARLAPIVEVLQPLDKEARTKTVQALRSSAHIDSGFSGLIGKLAEQMALASPPPPSPKEEVARVQSAQVTKPIDPSKSYTVISSPSFTPQGRQMETSIPSKNPESAFFDGMEDTASRFDAFMKRKAIEERNAKAN